MSIEQEKELAEFIAEHGGPLLKIKGLGDDTRLLQDGAGVSPGWCGRGPILYPPSEDPLKLLEARRLYWRERVRIVVSVFTHVRRKLLGLSFNTITWDEQSWGPPPDGHDEIKTLEHIAAAVEVERRKLRDVEDEYESLPEIVAGHEQEKEAAKSRDQTASRAMDLRGKIERMSV